MQSDDQKIVLFVDLLGFARLTEQHALDTKTLRQSERIATQFQSAFTQLKNPLTHAFTEFHRALKWALLLAEMEYSSTAITFSDSAFIATRNLFEAARIGVYLMQSLLRNGIPMRAGIAAGSFEAVRFRSDISTDGGDHAAQFLGTAVVRAHATEKCGIKGCRLLLHPSTIELLDDSLHNPKSASNGVGYLKCAATECQNERDVRQEINYWTFGPTDEKNAWRAFQDMWDAAPPEESNHYQATAEAINRMRIARGQPSLKSLRRRTLPRRASGDE